MAEPQDRAAEPQPLDIARVAQLGRALADALASQWRECRANQTQGLNAADTLIRRTRQTLQRYRQEPASGDTPPNTEAGQALAALEAIADMADTVEKVGMSVRRKISERLMFSDLALREVGEIFHHSRAQVRDVSDALATSNPTLRAHVMHWCGNLSQLMNQFTRTHEERLISGVCSDRGAVIYLEMFSAFRRLCRHVRRAALLVPEDPEDESTE